MDLDIIGKWAHTLQLEQAGNKKALLFDHIIPCSLMSPPSWAVRLDILGYFRSMGPTCCGSEPALSQPTDRCAEWLVVLIAVET